MLNLNISIRETDRRGWTTAVFDLGLDVVAEKDEYTKQPPNLFYEEFWLANKPSLSLQKNMEMWSLHFMWKTTREKIEISCDKNFKAKKLKSGGKPTPEIEALVLIVLQWT